MYVSSLSWSWARGSSTALWSNICVIIVMEDRPPLAGWPPPTGLTSPPPAWWQWGARPLRWLSAHVLFFCAPAKKKKKLVPFLQYQQYTSILSSMAQQSMMPQVFGFAASHQMTSPTGERPAPLPTGVDRGADATSPVAPTAPKTAERLPVRGEQFLREERMIALCLRVCVLYISCVFDLQAGWETQKGLWVRALAACLPVSSRATWRTRATTRSCRQYRTLTGSRAALWVQWALCRSTAPPWTRTADSTMPRPWRCCPTTWASAPCTCTSCTAGACWTPRTITSTWRTCTRVLSGRALLPATTTRTRIPAPRLRAEHLCGTEAWSRLEDELSPLSRKPRSELQMTKKARELSCRILQAVVAARKSSHYFCPSRKNLDLIPSADQTPGPRSFIIIIFFFFFVGNAKIYRMCKMLCVILVKSYSATDVSELE